MNLQELHSIWQVPVYLPYLKPALTDEMVKQAEERIGYKLPKEFIDLLKTQNGGCIRYELPGSPHSQIAGIGKSFPSFTEFEWLLEYEGAVSYELKGLFLFDGDGHWNLCLDYRKNINEPEITYIGTESDVEEKIADNFREYLTLLTLKTDGEYVVRTDVSIEETTKQISHLTGVAFNEPDTFAQGYPIYSAQLSNGWIWISPNIVPAGFIRPGEEKYHELKHWMDTSAIRYPELLETDLLLTVSADTEGQKLIETLNEKGLSIIGLKLLIDKSPNR